MEKLQTVQHFDVLACKTPAMMPTVALGLKERKKHPLFSSLRFNIYFRAKQANQDRRVP